MLSKPKGLDCTVSFKKEEQNPEWCTKRECLKNYNTDKGIGLKEQGDEDEQKIQEEEKRWEEKEESSEKARAYLTFKIAGIRLSSGM